MSSRKSSWLRMAICSFPSWMFAGLTDITAVLGNVGGAVVDSTDGVAGVGTTNDFACVPGRAAVGTGDLAGTAAVADMDVADNLAFPTGGAAMDANDLAGRAAVDDDLAFKAGGGGVGTENFAGGTGVVDVGASSVSAGPK